MGVSEAKYKKMTVEEVQNSCFMMTGLKNEATAVNLYGVNRKLATMVISFRRMRKGITDFFLNGGKQPKL